MLPSADGLYRRRIGLAHVLLHEECSTLLQHVFALLEELGRIWQRNSLTIPLKTKLKPVALEHGVGALDVVGCLRKDIPFLARSYKAQQLRHLGNRCPTMQRRCATQSPLVLRLQRGQHLPNTELPGLALVELVDNYLNQGQKKLFNYFKMLFDVFFSRSKWPGARR